MCMGRAQSKHCWSGNDHQPCSCTGHTHDDDDCDDDDNDDNDNNDNDEDNRGGAKIAYVAIRSLHKFM